MFIPKSSAVGEGLQRGEHPFQKLHLPFLISSCPISGAVISELGEV